MTAHTRSPRPLARAFSAAQSAAFGLMSAAMTLAAPARAAASARMPDPVPTSSHALARQVETIDEGRKGLAADEEAGMKHRRAHGEAKARRTRRPGALPRQDQVVGEEMNDTAQQTAERAMRHPAAAERPPDIEVPGRAASAIDLIHDGLAPATRFMEQGYHPSQRQCCGARRCDCRGAGAAEAKISSERIAEPMAVRPVRAAICRPKRDRY